MTTKLILFEGIAGLGKTTSAKSLSSCLTKENFAHRLILESDNPYRIRGFVENDVWLRAEIINQWRLLLEEISNHKKVYIVDAFFMQQSINYLIWLNVNNCQIKSHVFEIEKLVSQFKPLLIYLYSDNQEVSILRTINARSNDWYEKNIETMLEAPFVKESDILDAKKATYEFFSRVRRVADEIFNELKINKLAIPINENNYSKNDHLILSTVTSHLLEF